MFHFSSRFLRAIFTRSNRFCDAPFFRERESREKHKPRCKDYRAQNRVLRAQVEKALSAKNRRDAVDAPHQRRGQKRKKCREKAFRRSSAFGKREPNAASYRGGNHGHYQAHTISPYAVAAPRGLDFAEAECFLTKCEIAHPIPHAAVTRSAIPTPTVAIS